MPSVNNAGINFSLTSVFWELQSPLPAINFSSTEFLWEMQNPLPAENYSAPATTYALQNPLPAINFESTPFLWQTQAGANVVYYYQRVFSSGLNVWCYYTTQNTVNATPLSTATNPNWTGSIAAYELVTTSAV